MFVGVTRIVLNIPGARSLKERRRVVHAFRDRVRARLSASIAEVGDLERYQVATLGVAVVARSSRHCSELLSDVAKVARGLREALLIDLATEVVPFGPGGASVRGGIEQTFERDAFQEQRGRDEGEDQDQDQDAEASNLVKRPGDS